MRRKAGELLDIETRLLGVLAQPAPRCVESDPERHGFGLATVLADQNDARRLTGHGTLYKALSRLEAAGLVVSRWENDDTERLGRPRRRLYRITDDGRAALAAHQLRSLKRSPVLTAGIVWS